MMPPSRSPSTPLSTNQLLGPLSLDILLMVFDALDLSSLLTANNVCASWRALLARHWKRRYLALEDVDSARKWRLRALDGEGEEWRDEEEEGKVEVEEKGKGKSMEMPEGDGRGVSGPPVDPTLFARLALKSGWGTEFKSEVIDKLDEDSVFMRLLNDAQDEELVLPQATDLVYQWGTRLDKPDWHQLCLLHALMRRNWKTGNVVSSTIAPLYLPSSWRNFTLADDDPGDDAILFTAYTRGPGDTYEYVLVALERTTGEMRHISTLPLAPEAGHGFIDSSERLVSAFHNIGVGLSYVNDEDQWETHVSGRALNHLCPELARRGTRDRHLRRLGTFPVSFNNLDMSNFDDKGMSLVQFTHTSLEWERLRPETVDDDEREWEHSIPIKEGWNVETVQETESYLLLGVGLKQIHVYNKATKELFASLPAGVTDEEARNNDEAQVALLTFSVPMEERARRKGETSDVVTRPLAIKGHTARDDEYWLAVQSNIWGNGPVNFEHFWSTENHMLVKIECGGFLLIPYLEDVLAQAASLPFEKRARFVAQRTVLIDPGKDKFVPYAANRDRFVLDFVKEGRSAAFVLDIASLPPLSPSLVENADARVELKGHVILRRQDPAAELVEVHLLGGYMYEYLEWPLDSDEDDQWNASVSKAALRITSYEAVPPK